MIEVRNLYVTYGWRREPILKGVNTILHGKCLILGPNGSGKSTLFRSICGLTTISSGEIIIDGKPIGDIHATSRLVSTNLPEVYELLRLNVYDLMHLYMDLTGGDLNFAFELVEEFGLDRTFLAKRKLNELSAGQKKVVCNALALSACAKHVLLDEPFEQLDPAKKTRLLRHLKGYDGTVLVNTHETWLIKRLMDWEASFMFEGLMYGPIVVKNLLDAYLYMGDLEGALLKLSVSGKTVSITTEPKGLPILDIENLDKIYELNEAEM
ncbi:ATP-binding cassette domain-containing protein [Candidatus Bathyarchaeota archaeon]|nr:ATP-binding cassette domain-containing protein [Candidatus Bathyarchaeota archaeon]